MTSDLTPEKLWVERDPLALVMFAAWVNTPIDKLPIEMRAHTTPQTQEAWERVANAAKDFLATPAPTDNAALAGSRCAWCGHPHISRFDRECLRCGGENHNIAPTPSHYWKDVCREKNGPEVCDEPCRRCAAAPSPASSSSGGEAVLIRPLTEEQTQHLISLMNQTNSAIVINPNDQFGDAWDAGYNAALYDESDKGNPEQPTINPYTGK